MVHQSQLLQNRMVFLHKMWSMNIMPLTQKRSLIWVVHGCQTLIREVLITVALCSIEQVIQGIKKKSKRISVYSTMLDSLKKEPCNNITKSTRTAEAVSSPIDTSREPVRHAVRMVHVETSATLVEQRMSHQNSRILSPR